MWSLSLLKENDFLLRHRKEQEDEKGKGCVAGERLSLQDRIVSPWPEDESKERTSGDSHSGCHFLLSRVRMLGF